MAANVPDKLKAADLTRFIVRAAQLENAKPVVSYWCEYWIVNQILSKGLHNADSECFNYTMALMDKLENIKAENATNDAIIDDTAGQAYVEHFGLETFFRADRTIKANKVTKQTADTFSAAATFLELLNIWASPDADTAAKIRYAKWNAVRIVRAIKEGKDPNESNPKIEAELEENLPTLDPNDPEVRALESAPRQATVEEVPDEQDRVEAKLATQSSIDQSLHPSAQVSARGSPVLKSFEPYPKDGFPYNAVQDDNVSPMEASPNPRNGSLGGGYFPEVPSSIGGDDSNQGDGDDLMDLGLPQQPSAPPGSNDFESFPPPSIPDDPPQDYYKQSPPPQQAPQHFQQPTSPPPPQFHAPPPAHTQPPPNAAYYTPPPQSPYIAPPPQPTPQFQQRSHHGGGAAPSAAAQQQLIADDVAIAKAQKHAKWAISALNFEDVETAVRELREALKTLGAH